MRERSAETNIRIAAILTVFFSFRTFHWVDFCAHVAHGRCSFGALSVVSSADPDLKRFNIIILGKCSLQSIVRSLRCRSRSETVEYHHWAYSDIKRLNIFSISFRTSTLGIQPLLRTLRNTPSRFIRSIGLFVCICSPRQMFI